ncbi:MAG: glycosyltransferase [Bryobacteraceae bacterium]
MGTRVLHVIPSLDERTGGPLRAVLDLSFLGQTYGLHSEIVGPGPIRMKDNPLDSALIHETATPTLQSYAYSRDLRSWLEANVNRFDGVVSHGMWLYPNWITGKVCYRAGIPYACFPHGMLDLWSVQEQGTWKRLKKTAYWHLREKLIYRRAQRLFFTTMREMENARKTFALGHDTLHLVPYGIKHAVEKVERAEDERINQLATGSYALFLSRVHPKKNVDLLLTAWGTAKRPAGWKLCIAGPVDDEYKDRLLGLVNHYGMGDSLLFLDHVSGVNKQFLFQNAKWFMLPSSQENFGVAVLEAIGQRCPVVISDQVYLSDYFPSSAEILPVSAAAWKLFIEERMADEQHRQKVLADDQAYLRPRFDIDRVAADWVKTMTDSFLCPSSGVSNA